jgi:chromosome segregation ATPase
MALSAKIAQQKERARIASEKSSQLQHQVDDLRAKESARMQREAAARAVELTQTRLNETRAALEAKQQAIRDLQNEIPQLAQKTSLLLFELDRVRTELQRLPGA